MTPSFSVRKTAKPICLTILVFLVSACTAPFPVYSVTGKNVETIRAIPASVKVGKFTGDQTSVSCRLQPIGPEDDKTFASYIRDAFNSEVVISGVGQKNTAIELSGTVKQVEVDCGIVNGSWTIEMELSVNKQRPFTIKSVRKFSGNYFGGVVLGRAYAAFIPAVQKFVYDVLNSRPVQEAAKQRKSQSNITENG